MSITVDYMGETVTIPSVPAEYFEEYPYGAIIGVTSIGITTAFCVLSESEIFYAPLAFAQEAVGVNSDTLGSLANGYAYCQPGGDSWNEPISKSGEFILHSFIQQEITSWDILWSNHEIRTATGFDDGGMPVIGTEIYFPNSEAPKPPFVLPDGTELPALPGGVFEKYPYGVIYEGTEDSVTSHYFACTVADNVVIPKELTGLENDSLGSLANGYALYKCDPASDADWTLVAEYEDNDFAWMNLWFDLKWTNHDVFAIASYNDDGSYNTTLYHKSDVNYRIPGGWLNSMANQARRMDGSSDGLDADEMREIFRTVTPGSGGSSVPSAEGVEF